MRTRKPSETLFPVPNLGFQTDSFLDSLIGAVCTHPPRHVRQRLDSTYWCTNCLAELGRNFASDAESKP